MTAVKSEPHEEPPKNETIKVAIVGGGVTGLSAAWHLISQSQENSTNKKTYNVTVFESEDRLGGHAYTMSVPHDYKKESSSSSSSVNVDVGFMVFNYENYPNMTEWFKALGVKPEKSDMSLSVSLDRGKTVEWCSDGVAGLAAKKSQLLFPSFYKLIRDMLRFHKEAEKVLTYSSKDPRRFVSVGEYLRTHEYSDGFCKYYLLPMMAALWSASMEDVLNFPMEQLVGFLCNHKMLRIFDRPQWMTVADRSLQYTSKMNSFIKSKENASVHLSTPIRKIVTTTNTGKNEYELFTDDNKSVGSGFRHVIFACQPPITGNILSTSSSSDKDLISLLKDIEYADNVIYLHSDSNLMPKSKAAWASWNCLGKSSLIQTTMSSSEPSSTSTPSSSPSLDGHESRMKAVYVTYHLNRLQNLKTNKDIFVSLNPHDPPESSKTHRKFILAHPQFTSKTTEARQEIERKYQGANGLWFAGAWSGYGFHEDGCRSGFHVATLLSQVALPWVDYNKNDDEKKNQNTMVCSPPNLAPTKEQYSKMHPNTIIYNILVRICQKIVLDYFKKIFSSNKKNHGTLLLTFHKGNDEQSILFRGGEEESEKKDTKKDIITLQVMDDQFFIDFAFLQDEGLGRSYMSGYFTIDFEQQEKKQHIAALGGNPDGLFHFFTLLNKYRSDFNSPNYHIQNYYKGWLFYPHLLLYQAFDTMKAKSSVIFSFPKFLFSHLWSISKNMILLPMTDPLHYKNTSKITKDLILQSSYINNTFKYTPSMSTTAYPLLASTFSGIYQAVWQSPTKLSFQSHATANELESAMIGAYSSKINSLVSRLQIQFNPDTLKKILVLDTNLYSKEDTAHQVGSTSNWGFILSQIIAKATSKYGENVQFHAITSSTNEKEIIERYLRSSGIDTTKHVINVVPGMVNKHLNYKKLSSFLSEMNYCAFFDRVLVLDSFTLVQKAKTIFGSVLDKEPNKKKQSTSKNISTCSIYTPSFFECIDYALRRDGILVLETTIMNKKLASSSCKKMIAYKLPSVHGIMDAVYHGSTFTLEFIDNIGLHSSKSLNDWRKFLNYSKGNGNTNMFGLHSLDDGTWRAWNFYGAYCQAAYESNDINSMVMIFSRPGAQALVALNDASTIMQSTADFLLDNE